MVATGLSLTPRDVSLALTTDGQPKMLVARNFSTECLRRFSGHWQSSIGPTGRFARYLDLDLLPDGRAAVAFQNVPASAARQGVHAIEDTTTVSAPLAYPGKVSRRIEVVENPIRSLHKLRLRVSGIKPQDVIVLDVYDAAGRHLVTSGESTGIADGELIVPGWRGGNVTGRSGVVLIAVRGSIGRTVARAVLLR